MLLEPAVNEDHVVSTNPVQSFAEESLPAVPQEPEVTAAPHKQLLGTISGRVVKPNPKYLD